MLYDIHRSLNWYVFLYYFAENENSIEWKKHSRSEFSQGACVK